MVYSREKFSLNLILHPTLAPNLTLFSSATLAAKLVTVILLGSVTQIILLLTSPTAASAYPAPRRVLGGLAATRLTNHNNNLVVFQQIQKIVSVLG